MRRPVQHNLTYAIVEKPGHAIEAGDGEKAYAAMDSILREVMKLIEAARIEDSSPEMSRPGG